MSEEYTVPGAKELVLERFHHSQNYFSLYHQRCARWYDVYRGWWSGRYQPYRNNVVIPLLFSAVWSDVARKINVSLNTWPILAMEGGGPEDAVIARKNELLVSAQLRDSKTLQKSVDMFLTGNLYGTAICRHGWRSVEKLLLRRDSVVVNGRRYERKADLERRLVFDGPDWEPLDVLDCFPQPGRKTIPEMDWFVFRYYLDIDDLFEMSSDENPVFDRSSVEEVRRRGISSVVQRETDTRVTMRRNPFANEQPKEKYKRSVEILECWGRVPLDMGYATPHRVISLANRQVILRDRPFPLWSGEIPLLAYSPLKDPHYFTGVGKMEIGERLQITANRLANHKLDVMDQIIDPTWGVDINKIVNPAEVYTKPGHMIRTEGPSSEVLQPLTPDLRGVQMSYSEIDQVDSWIQQGTAVVKDVAQGMGGDRSTAREFLGRQESVSIRLLLESRMAEEMWLEPLGEAYRWHNRQFLTLPHERQILGMYGQTDPITGAPLPPESVVIDDEAVNRDYDLRARGATVTLAKSIRQQNLVMLYQTMAAQPQLAMLMNWRAFQRQMFLEFDVKNVDELTTPPPDMQMVLQAMAGGQLGGLPGAPSGEPASLGGELPGEGLEGTLEGSLVNQ